MGIQRRTQSARRRKPPAVGDARQVHERVAAEHAQPAALARQQGPGEAEDLPQLPLVAVLIHLLDVVAVAEARGLGQVEVALAVAAFAQVVGGHAQAGLGRGRRTGRKPRMDSSVTTPTA